MNRLTQVLSKDCILKAIVDKMNHKLTTYTLPLQSELEHIKSQLEHVSLKKKRYLDLFEQGNVDKSMFTGRLQEIHNELDQLQAEKSRLELELSKDHGAPVSYEVVRELISGLNYVLSNSPYEQRKTLLHLFIKRISLNENKEIEDIQLCFDEQVDCYFHLQPIAATIDRHHMKKHNKFDICI